MKNTLSKLRSSSHRIDTLRLALWIMSNENRHKNHIFQVMLFVMMHKVEKSIQMNHMGEVEFKLVRQLKQELTGETAQ